jgi:large subunit ribosomal protein L2
MVDFYFHDKKSIPAKVETIEYDPYRTAYIALICYKDGERRYVLAHKDMKVGDIVVTDNTATLTAGNRMEVSVIPV